MAQALIIFTSLTGNTEQCADIVADALESHGIEVTVHDVMQAEVSDYEKYDLCLVGSYTYGVDGVLPDEMLDFAEDLAELDLTGKVFGVFGSGDVFYEEYFCTAVDTLEEVFTKTGAVKGANGVKVNMNPEDEDVENLEAFAAELASKV